MVVTGIAYTVEQATVVVVVVSVVVVAVVSGHRTQGGTYPRT